jgi:hypothetical protein
MVRKNMESDRKPVIFIGSSSEARDFAEALQINLDGVAEPIPWTQVDFELSRSTLDTLESELDRADFAAFVFAPDDETRIRGEHLRTTRDNVLIELGLFIGRLGRSRTFIVLATGTEEKLRMPTDLLGLTAATYDYRSYDPQRRNARAVMGPASFEIRNAIQRLGARRQTANEPRRRVKGVLERGSTEVITNFADSGIYVADNRHEYPQELKRRLRNGELVPMKYLYWTPQGSAHWLAICQQGSYTFYRNSVALLREKAYEL